MYSFLKLSLIVLTLRLIVIRSDFCSDYAEEVGDVNTKLSTTNLQFITTKDVQYLYLKKGDKEYVYEIDVSCSKSCPQIGDKQEMSKVFNISGLKMAHFQDGFTYLVIGEKESQKVHKYSNTKKVDNYGVDNFWKRLDIAHAVSYEWHDANRTVRSRFMPPILTNEEYPKYGFSSDNYKEKVVEVRGNFEMVNIVNGQNKPFLYIFGDSYLIPWTYISYLPLPNGDALINLVEGKEMALYTRKDGVSVNAYRNQNFYNLFGCTGEQIPKKTLTNFYGDNIYPSNFKKVNY